MIARALPTSRQRLLRQRQHGAVLAQADRRELERGGWRTTLEFRENNVRGRDGRLLQVEEIWHAEAERDANGARTRGVHFIQATAESVDEVWAKLRRQAELADVKHSDVPAAQAS
ncbi:MAG TPA: hypothetical protein VES40_10680 [Ilumatobacteraceae bacterium]|nr:hypothetical protein [Ilumatobacteraceae bacterium]